MFVHDHFGRRLTHLELGVYFLDLRSLLFHLGREPLYLLLVLRDRCLQVLNCAIEHGLFGGIGNGLGPDVAFGRKSTRIGSIGGDRAQSSIGIDHHHSSRGGGNRRTENIVDSAPVTDLAKYTVHTRVVADDDIIIDAGDTRPGHAAYGNVFTVADVTLERLITDGCVVASGGVGSERFPTSGRVGAAAGIVHERKVTGASVVRTGVVKDERIGSNGGVLCAAGVEQERCHANRGIGTSIVEGQRSTADTGIETAGRIQKERSPTKCCVSSAGGERTKRIASLRCREVGDNTRPLQRVVLRVDVGRGCGHGRG